MSGIYNVMGALCSELLGKAAKRTASDQEAYVSESKVTVVVASILFGGFVLGVGGLITSAVFIPNTSDWRVIGMLAGGVGGIGSLALLTAFFATRKYGTTTQEVAT